MSKQDAKRANPRPVIDPEVVEGQIASDPGLALSGALCMVQVICTTQCIAPPLDEPETGTPEQQRDASVEAFNAIIQFGEATGRTDTPQVRLAAHARKNLSGRTDLPKPIPRERRI